MSGLINLLRQVGVEPPRLKFIDVGAMDVGRSRWDRLLATGLVDVVGFEPDPEAFARLAKTAGCGRTFLPHALGDGTRRRFHVCAFPATSSLLEPNTALIQRFTSLAELMAVQRVEEIETRCLDDLPEVAGADVIKLDTQGSELMILEHGLRTLAGMVLVETEVEIVELYRDQPLFAEVDQLMRRQGFMLHTLAGCGTRTWKPLQIHNQPYGGLHQMLWSDAIYVPHPDRLATLGAAKLYKLALTLHEVFGSHDLALLALIEADRAAGSRTAPAYLDGLKNGSIR
jgi:FkbM family methyltransferase